MSGSLPGHIPESASAPALARTHGKFAFISGMEMYPWGGSEELWSQAASRLLAQGAEVAISSKFWPKVPLPLQRLAQGGAQLHWRTPMGRWERIARRLVRLPERNQLAWLQTTHPDLVVISQGDIRDGVRWALECVRQQQRYVLIVQAATDYGWPFDTTIRDMVIAYENAARVFFVSQSNLMLVRNILARPLPQAAVVRNPFNVPYDQPLPWPEANGEWRLACVARLQCSAKGQDLLFEVLRQEKWRARSVHVTLYGAGVNAETLRELSRHLGLDNVTFAGHVDNVQEVWRTHHALILPSRMEGLPLALVEAMLCGRTAIVTNVAGNAELVEDNRTGFVAAAATVPLLEEAMERAWQQRHQWPQMAQHAAQRVRELVPPDPVAVFVKQLVETAHAPA